MTYHIWGDDWFEANEKDLHNAMKFIETMYKRRTGKYPMMKEKYGTIRYEFIELWLTSNEFCLILFEILRRACVKYPGVSPEIVSNIRPMINKKDHYYSGFFDGILLRSE